MAHAFKTIPAKSTFGTLQEELYQSDYINRKKRKCVNKSNLIVGKYTKLNKSNLIVGQYTKLNLSDVCTVSNGPPPANPCEFNNNCNPCQNSEDITIDASDTNTIPFYVDYTIDPLGELFGKTYCGILNYPKYMVFNPPQKKL